MLEELIHMEKLSWEDGLDSMDGSDGPDGIEGPKL